MQSHRIIHEPDCHLQHHQKEPTQIFTSPKQHRVNSGHGMRTLPRLSASQAVHNLRDIASEKDRRYRHVSHHDFHNSHDTTKSSF